MWTLDLLTRALPADSQARYQEEWQAELHELSGQWARLRYLGSNAGGLLSLRRALVTEQRWRPSVSLARVHWPLLTRACLIALCGLLAAISPPLGPRIAVTPALLLLLVAALATLPVPPTVPVWLQPLTETLAATLVVGALQSQASLFLPYVLVPLTTAGLAAGLGVALVAAGLASLILLLTALLAEPQLPVLDALLNTEQGVGSWMWVLIFIAVSVTAASTRRLFIRETDALGDPLSEAEGPRSEPTDVP